MEYCNALIVGVKVASFLSSKKNRRKMKQTLNEIQSSLMDSTYEAATSEYSAAASDSRIQSYEYPPDLDGIYPENFSDTTGLDSISSEKYCNGLPESLDPNDSAFNSYGLTEALDPNDSAFTSYGFTEKLDAIDYGFQSHEGVSDFDFNSYADTAPVEAGKYGNVNYEQSARLKVTDFENCSETSDNQQFYYGETAGLPESNFGNPYYWKKMEQEASNSTNTTVEGFEFHSSNLEPADYTESFDDPVDGSSSGKSSSKTTEPVHFTPDELSSKMEGLSIMRHIVDSSWDTPNELFPDMVDDNNAEVDHDSSGPRHPMVNSHSMMKTGTTAANVKKGKKKKSKIRKGLQFCALTLVDQLL